VKAVDGYGMKVTCLKQDVTDSSGDEFALPAAGARYVLLGLFVSGNSKGAATSVKIEICKGGAWVEVAEVKADALTVNGVVNVSITLPAPIASDLQASGGTQKMLKATGSVGTVDFDVYAYGFMQES